MNLFFPEEMWGEDRLFLIAYLRGAKKISVIPHCFYDYILRKESLTSRFVSNKGLLCKRIHEEILLLAEEKAVEGKVAEKIFSYMYGKSLLSVLASLESPSCPLSRKEKRAYGRKLLSRDMIAPLLPPTPSDGFFYGVLCRILRGRSLFLNLLSAKALYFALRFFPTRFRKSKHPYN
jgi:hypothetical protein